MRRRFVVQRHAVRPGNVHFDFMIERSPGGPLATFRLEGPLPPAGGEVAGERSFDHRALYLEYEGQVSGGRGVVKIVARGELDDLEGDVAGSTWAGQVVGGSRLSISAEGERVKVCAS